MKKINVESIELSLRHAEALREKYRGKDKEQYRFWKQEAYRLKTDIDRAESINFWNEKYGTITEEEPTNEQP